MPHTETSPLSAGPEWFERASKAGGSPIARRSRNLAREPFFLRPGKRLAVRLFAEREPDR